MGTGLGAIIIGLFLISFGLNASWICIFSAFCVTWCGSWVLCCGITLSMWLCNRSIWTKKLTKVAKRLERMANFDYHGHFSATDSQNLIFSPLIKASVAASFDFHSFASRFCCSHYYSCLFACHFELARRREILSSVVYSFWSSGRHCFGFERIHTRKLSLPLTAAYCIFC